MESLKKLLDYQKAIADLQYTINLLSWELRVSAPKKSEDNLSDLITYHEVNCLNFRPLNIMALY